MSISVTKGWPLSHYRPQEEITVVTVSLCLKLALMFIERHSLRDCTELICLSIKLFFTSIHRWETGEKKETEETEHQKECAISQLSDKLRLKAAEDFRCEIAYHSPREWLTKDLQVWQFLTSASLVFIEKHQLQPLGRACKKPTGHGVGHAKLNFYICIVFIRP